MEAVGAAWPAMHQVETVDPQRETIDPPWRCFPGRQTNAFGRNDTIYFGPDMRKKTITGETRRPNRARGKALKAVIAVIGLCTPALAHDNGQFANVPDAVRSWFKNVKSRHGIPCCDIADGHRTDFDMRDNQYWVPINGNWMPVPPEAVLTNVGNPVGDAVVWYSDFGGRVWIRCFVPGGGA